MMAAWWISNTMVKLTSILEQYPWNNQAPEDWTDKEVLTQLVSPEDASKVWSITMYPCLQDYAFVGFRIRANTQVFPKSVRLISGDGKRRSLLGFHTDNLTNGFNTVNWVRFKYPLPCRLLSLNEDEPLLEVVFDSEVFGKVEFLAQEFDELKDENRALWFCENDYADAGWILSPNATLYRLDTLTKRKEYPNAVSLYSLTTQPL